MADVIASPAVDLDFRVQTDLADPEWDSFVERTPGGHHVQSSLWAQVKAVVGWLLLRVIAVRDGVIVGGAQILTRPITYLVRHAPGVDARFVHLIRDPSAATYSWKQNKEFQPGVMMSQKSPTRSPLQWSSRNAMTDAFLGGDDGAEVPSRGSHVVDIDRVSHTVFGNEVRYTGTRSLTDELFGARR